MPAFPVHTLATAPLEARAVLVRVEDRLGFVPRLQGAMADAPAVLEADAALTACLDATSLAPVELHVARLAASVENASAYGVAAATVEARAAGVPETVLEAVRGAREIDDPRLEVLRLFTKGAVRLRGRLNAGPIEAFLSFGYSTRQVQEVLLVVAARLLADSIAHVARSETDGAFGSGRWSPGGPPD